MLYRTFSSTKCVDTYHLTFQQHGVEISRDRQRTVIRPPGESPNFGTEFGEGIRPIAEEWGEHSPRNPQIGVRINVVFFLEEGGW